MSSSAAAGDVTFPDDYPNSVKHFLLMGCVGFAFGAIVFLYLTIMRTKSSVTHSLMFLIAAIGAMAYYAMWTGLGVMYKTTDKTPRVIFWGRYLEQLLTQPLLLITMTYISKTDTAVMVSLAAQNVLLVLAALIGSTTIAPMKYMWWFTSVVFTVLIVIQLLPTAREAHFIYKVLTYGVIACYSLFNLIWLMGSEGSASLGLSQEVGIYTIVDIVCKVGFGLYFLVNFDTVMGDEDGDDQAKSQQYV